MHTLPAEIRVVEEPGGVRYVLPPRPSIWPPDTVRRLRATGITWLIFGVFLLFGMLGQAYLFGEFGNFHGFIWFALVGLVLAGLGSAVMLAVGGHSEVAVRGGMLCEIEHFGPFRWVGRRPVRSVRRFDIQTARSRGAEATTDDLTNRIWSITVECDGAKPLRFVAPCCRRDWLQGLGQELARRCQQAAAAEFTQQSIELPVTDDAVDATSPPPGSNVVVERHSDSITLIVPPGGLRSTTVVVIFLFAVCFAAVGAALAVGTLRRDAPAPPVGGEDFDRMNLFGSAAVCGLVAIGTAIFALSLARRRAVFAVVGDDLVVLEEGLMRTRRREWRCDELSDIRNGPSGIDINDTAVPQLQIHLITGKHFGLLTGRDAMELEWLARELKAALKLPKSTLPGNPDLSRLNQFATAR